MTFTIDLQGRRALVTGAGRGIGRAIAHGLASAGAAVAVNDINPSEAEAVANEMIAEGGKATPLPFDVTRYLEVAAAIEAIGGTDVLVNNAGNAGAEKFGALVDFAESDPEEWSR
jgi:NAD(P)-dependent dehydrogenase (short-subunit alcohol dehydrogenase family)